MLTAMDIVVLLLIGGGAALGLMRGFVMEVLSLFAWAAAIFALKLLHGPVASLLIHVVKSPSGASVLSFVLVFGAVFFGGKLVAAQLGQRTKKSVLGSFDRVLGFGFGALKGLLIATVLFLGVNLVYDTIWGAASERPAFVKNSRTYPLLNASGRAVVDWVQRRRAAQAAAVGNEAMPAQANSN
jgi:membrane protein required for colicin V production